LSWTARALFMVKMEYEPRIATLPQDREELGSEPEDDLDGADEVDDGSFSVRDPLPMPTARAMSMKELHVLIHEGNIDLNPPYQRDVVWKEPKQIALIDSVFRNMYIPPILFANHVDSYGDTQMVCVDGKQRLTSVQKFIDGFIPCVDPLTKKRYWWTFSERSRGKKLLLPDKYKKIFNEKQFTVVEFQDIPGESEREVFQRVQNGVPLTPAEKLQALSSPWVDWINVLQKKYVTEDDGFSAHMKWDIARGRDFECLARACYLISNLPAHTMPGEKKLHKWLVETPVPSIDFKQQVHGVFDDFVYLASTPGLDIAFTKIEKRVSPVEFIYIALMLAKIEELDHEKKADYVLRLRQHLRDNFKDVRLNNAVWGSAWGFIEKIHMPGGKRKRGHEDDDDDDEYRPNGR